MSLTNPDLTWQFELRLHGSGQWVPVTTDLAGDGYHAAGVEEVQVGVVVNGQLGGGVAAQARRAVRGTSAAENRQGDHYDQEEAQCGQIVLQPQPAVPAPPPRHAAEKIAGVRLTVKPPL